jgi:hypothetical protein
MSTRAAHLRALRGRGAVLSRGGERRTCGARADRQRLEPLALEGGVARISLDILGREIRVRTVSWRLLNLVLGAVRRFGGQAADIRKTVSSFQCCHRVANPAWQWEAFSYVTSAEEGVVRWLRGAGLAATLSVAGASPGAGQDRKKG